MTASGTMAATTDDHERPSPQSPREVAPQGAARFAAQGVATLRAHEEREVARGGAVGEVPASRRSERHLDRAVRAELVGPRVPVGRLDLAAVVRMPHAEKPDLDR